VKRRCDTIPDPESLIHTPTHARVHTHAQRASERARRERAREREREGERTFERARESARILPQMCPARHIVSARQAYAHRPCVLRPGHPLPLRPSETLQRSPGVDAVCVCLLLQDLLQSCARGGGGEWRTCAMRYDEPRLVWTRLTTTH
jgi:hypothetical protein